MEIVSYELPPLFAAEFGEQCATACEAYGECGGNRRTAPCRCIWPSASGKRYACGECDVICRDRRHVDPHTGELGENCFASHIAAGYALTQTRIEQPAAPAFPLFIPLHTQDCTGTALDLRWVAADVRWVFNTRRKQRSAATLKEAFSTAAKTRNYLKVGATCQLLLVLNGEDVLLEQFWQMPRQAALRQLTAVGFEVSTGATFSVTENAETNISMPFSNHTAMLMRHNRVLAETQAAGMLSAPNLYWLDGDIRQIDRWASWLRDNPTIQVVSRDFTSTSHPHIIERKLSELLHLLDLTQRSYHVLIIGTGPANAPRIIAALAAAGHTTSIVTSAPIMKAQSGAKYEINDAGELVDFPCDKRVLLKPALSRHNLTLFENYLFSTIADQPAAGWALRNVTAA